MVRLLRLTQAGFLTCAAGTVFAVRRSGRQMSNLRLFALSFFGGFAGSMLAIPIGIAMSRSSMMSIEDPKHLSRVLQYQVEQRRQNGPLGRPPPPGEAGSGSAQDGQILAGSRPWEASTDGGASNTWGSSADDGADNFPSGRFGTTQGNGMSWGEAMQERTGSRNDAQLWTDAPPRDSWTAGPPPPASEQDWSMRPASDNTMPSGTGSGSRWAQLRNDRTSAPSVWENIRQQRAKESLAENQNSTRTPSASEKFAAEKRAAHERAVAEYNQAWERERMGIDETTGFDDSTRIR